MGMEDEKQLASIVLGLSYYHYNAMHLTEPPNKVFFTNKLSIRVCEFD